MSPNTICISIDVEWAHPTVLDYVLNLITERHLPATFFCTHQGVNVHGHERALHPNFCRDGDAFRSCYERAATDTQPITEIDTYAHITQTIHRLYPEALGVRTHRLLQDSRLLAVLAANQLQYDSSILLPGMPHLQPIMREHDILQLPIYYMDHQALLTGISDFSVTSLKLQQPGMKIFAFHPNLLYINATSIEHYQRSKVLYHQPERLITCRQTSRGCATLFEDLLDEIVRQDMPVATLGEVNRQWRMEHINADSR